MAKIPESDITSPGRPVRPAGHPDLFWYRPGYAIEEGEVGKYKFAGNLIGSSGSGGGGEPGGGGPGDGGPDGPPLPPTTDVPHLSDITIESNTKYFDEVGKERAKVVLKIKNSSYNKANVAGVDARIYQPKGA